MIKLIPDYIDALKKEIELRNQYIHNELIESVYFGGGTPSLLKTEQIFDIINHISQYCQLAADCEITLEGNPDDLSNEYLLHLSRGCPINRLSIGIQSFNEENLKLLNRRHNADQALECILNASKAGYNNISIDLIYGIPGTDTNVWAFDIKKAFSLDIRHISAYNLTIEEGTSLYRMIKKELIKELPEEDIIEQYEILCNAAYQNDYCHYEISNFAKDSCFSRHNTSYWQGKKYLGIGPAAHSYNGNKRSWNVRDIKEYIISVNKNVISFEEEKLNDIMKYNEYIIVSLRTIWGVNGKKIKKEFGNEVYQYFITTICPFVNSGRIIKNEDNYKIPEADWMIADYIISELLRADK